MSGDKGRTAASSEILGVFYIVDLMANLITFQMTFLVGSDNFLLLPCFLAMLRCQTDHLEVVLLVNALNP